MEKAFDFIAQNKVIVKQIVFILVWIHVLFMAKSKISKLSMLVMLNIYLLILHNDFRTLFSKTGVAQARIHLFSEIYLGFLFIYMATLIILLIRYLKSNEPDAQVEGIKNAFKTERHFKIAVVEVVIIILIVFLW